ncbi:MAG TPA: Snf7 family protein [Opitutaceae bacterium]|jgi:hypothetical protein
MKLFESREERAARAKFAIRKGQANISRYIQNCAKSREKYRDLTKRALAYGDERQARLFVRNLRHYDEQEIRWNRFLLKLEDVAMRGEAMGAMGDLMRSVQQVCTQISQGISLNAVTATAAKVEVGLDRVSQLEDSVGQIMGGLEVPAGETPEATPEFTADEREQLSPMLESLRQEVEAEAALARPLARERPAL